jgi:hypothetical protein
MSYIIVGSSGDPCPRCGRATEVREHKFITAKQLRKAFYYSRWFICVNPRCRTTTIVPDRFRVLNDPEPEVERRLEQIAEQLGSDWVTAASSAEVPW